MAIITKTRGDRLKIRQCFRNVTVVSAAFEYPLQPTGLLYSISGTGLVLSGVHNESPVTLNSAFPSAIVYNPGDGYIYYASTAELRRILPDGTGDEAVGILHSGTIDPYQFALSADGNRLLAWYRRSTPGGFDALYLKSYAFPINDTGTVIFETSDSNGSTGGLALDLDRQVYYLVNSGSGAGDGRVRKVNWDGSGHTILYTETTFGLDNFTGLAYDPVTDTIFYTQNGTSTRANELWKIDPDGTNRTLVVEFSSGAPGPEDLDLNIGGRYLVVPFQDGGIYEVLLDGTILATIRTADDAPGRAARLAEI